MKSKIVSKKIVKKGEVVDKKKTSLDRKKEKWSAENSFIKEENDKCLVVFPILDDPKDDIKGDLVFIAVLLLKKIFSINIYTRKSVTDVKSDPSSQELVYEFDKRYTKRIKEIEQAYYFGEIQISAATLSQLITYQFNFPNSKNWREQEGLKD